jgi:hypothetical protein
MGFSFYFPLPLLIKEEKEKNEIVSISLFLVRGK